MDQTRNRAERILDRAITVFDPYTVEGWLRPGRYIESYADLTISLTMDEHGACRLAIIEDQTEGNRTVLRRVFDTLWGAGKPSVIATWEDGRWESRFTFLDA